MNNGDGAGQLAPYFQMIRNWFACGDYTINYDHLVDIQIAEGENDCILWLHLSNRDHAIEAFRGTRAECVDFHDSILRHEDVYIPA